MKPESQDPLGSPAAEGDQPGLRKRMQGEAQRISSQHRQLDVFFDMVVSALERHSLQAARIAFTRFRDALEAHTTLEDEVFFPALDGLDRGVGAQLTELVHEHSVFAERLDALYEQLAVASEDFATGFHEFARDFAAHEQREEKLLAPFSSSSSR